MQRKKWKWKKKLDEIAEFINTNHLVVESQKNK